MSDHTEPAVPPGLADLPLEVRRAREVAKHLELQEGLTRQHLANAALERARAADLFARALRMFGGG